MKRLVPLAVFIVFCSPVLSSGLTLEEGLQVIASRSPEIEISKEDEKVSIEDLAIVRSNLYPYLNLYARHSWLRYQPEALFGPLGSVPIADRTSLTYGFEVRQLLFDFQRTSSLVQAALEGSTAKKHAVEVRRNNALLEFVIAYYDALEAERLLNLASQEVKRFEAHLADTRALLEEGLITRNDLLQAEVLLTDARQNEITMKNLYRTAIANLNRLLLRPLEEDVTIKDNGDIRLPFQSIEAAREIALSRRKELEALKAAIRAKQMELKSVKAEFYPTLFVAGGFQYEENPYMVHEENWSLMAGLNLNLFGGGERFARIRKIEAQIKRLDAEKRRLSDLIALEVQRAYLESQSSSHKTTVTRKAVEQAEENLRLQKLRYKEGLGTATEVTDAVTLLTLAETNQARALYEKRRAVARLLRATGDDLLIRYSTGKEQADDGRADKRE